MLAARITVVAKRSGESFDMAHTSRLLMVKRAAAAFPQDGMGSFYGHSCPTLAINLVLQVTAMGERLRQS